MQYSLWQVVGGGWVCGGDAENEGGWNQVDPPTLSIYIRLTLAQYGLGLELEARGFEVMFLKSVAEGVIYD